MKDPLQQTCFGLTLFLWPLILLAAVLFTVAFIILAGLFWLTGRPEEARASLRDIGPVWKDLGHLSP